MLDQEYSYVLKDGEIRNPETGELICGSDKSTYHVTADQVEGPKHYGLLCNGIPTPLCITVPVEPAMVYYGVFLVGDDARCRGFVEQLCSLIVEMPCGNQIKVGEIETFENVPCPCGNPKHWLFYRVFSTP